MKRHIEIKNNTKFYLQFVTIFVIALSLASFGCLMVYSASYYSAAHHYGNQYFFLFKQIIGVIVGLMFMIVFSFIDYHIWGKHKKLIMALSIISLIMVFIPGIGVESFGAKRWLSIFGFSIQPSEIAKFSLVIFIASELSERYNNIKSLKGLFPIILVAGLNMILIMLEPSMSVTMCIAFVCFSMLVAGGISKKHTLLFSIPAVFIVPILIILEPYRLKRLFAFLNPWASPQGEGFQLIQSLYSLGNGGLFGVGLFNSRQKFLFLPFAESDFILSIIGEEFGFVGTTLLLGIFFFLFVQLIKISLHAKDRFGSSLVAGIGFLIIIQTMLNLAVVSGSIPPTGLPLPFISSGGTAVIMFMSCVGICLNVLKQSHKSNR